MQTAADSQTQNNFNFASTVAFDEQLVGAGVYSEDEDGYWTSGVTATNIQASRTSSSDKSSTIHAADSTGSSDGTSSSRQASNLGLSLAVITTYAIASTSGPSATSTSTTSDTFSYQDHFDNTASSQSAGKLCDRQQHRRRSVRVRWRIPGQQLKLHKLQLPGHRRFLS